MKTLVLMTIGFGMVSGLNSGFGLSVAEAAQIFTGEAAGRVNVLVSCSVYPAPALAEKDAEVKAADFCDTFNRRAVLASTFAHSNSCIRGKGYSNGEWTPYTHASAQFRCL